MMKRDVIARQELADRILRSEIDTVIMAFVDRYGRLVGKRATGRFFLDHVADHGTENCDYLLTCDIDNQPSDGFRFSSFDKGYGDMLAMPDWDTVRIASWLPKTAIIMCDLLDVAKNTFVDVAPRSILRAQVEQAVGLIHRGVPRVVKTCANILDFGTQHPVVPGHFRPKHRCLAGTQGQVLSGRIIPRVQHVE